MNVFFFIMLLVHPHQKVVLLYIIQTLFFISLLSISHFPVGSIQMSPAVNTYFAPCHLQLPSPRSASWQHQLEEPVVQS